jgi:hypothetical protein
MLRWRRQSACRAERPPRPSRGSPAIASPRPMPPATKTGTSPARSGRISCASTLVETGPIWPPASMPSMTSASTPERTSFLASASAGAKQITLAPPSLMRLDGAALGRQCRRPARHALTPMASSRRDQIVSCGCMVMRFTPNGFGQRLRRRRSRVSSRSGVIAPQAITPKPPALLMAETRLRSLTQLIAPPMMATSGAQEGAAALPAPSAGRGPKACAHAACSAVIRRPAHRRCAARARPVRCIPRRSAPKP